MMSIGSYLKANMGASFTQVREVEKKSLQLSLSRTYHCLDDTSFPSKKDFRLIESRLQRLKNYWKLRSFRPKGSARTSDDSPEDMQHPSTWWTLDFTSAVPVFPCLFFFLRLKEQQMHVGRIDLVWANCHRAKRPDTATGINTPCPL